ncbi:MAG: InlB B-repeat-containing protein [Lachnospiraceae bacterium]|nr:InlB B-repeat-containing protein [Lachnospiraceae bacterium]
MKIRRTAALAVLMTIILCVSSVSMFHYIRVYADGEEAVVEQSWDEGTQEGIAGPAPVTEYAVPEQPDPVPAPAPEVVPIPDPQPDPFDYSLTCYTPNLDFGTIQEGDYKNNKQFSIVNTGSTDVPLTYAAADPYTSFRLEIPENLYLRPGDQAIFAVSPATNLKEGVYNATYTFFSANDYRRTHYANVTFTVKVTAAVPVVTKVVISPGSASVPAGKTMQFKAEVQGSNNFNKDVTWSVGGNNSSGTFIDVAGKLTVDREERASTISVTATSRQTPSVFDTIPVSITTQDYLIKVTASPSEGGSVTGGGSVSAGSTVKLNQSANNNYRFEGWYENDRLLTEASSLVIQDISADRDIQARFKRVSCNVRVDVNNTNGGTVTGGGKVEYGGSVTLNAKAKDGYKFEGFIEDNKKITDSPSLQLNNITTDRNITASFRQSRFSVNVTINPAGAGKISGAGQYNENSRCDLEIFAESGWDFTGWTINGQTVSYSPKYTIEKVTGNYNLTANFAKHNTKTYKITSMIASQGGGIIPSGDNYVTEGGTAVYTIVPLQGYKILAVAVDGVNIGPVSSYTFSNVRGQHAIAASFTKIQQPAQQNTTPVQPPKQNTQPAPQPVQPAQQNTQPAQQATEYNADTATSGALPAQVVVEDDSLSGDGAGQTAPADGTDAQQSVSPWENAGSSTDTSGGVLARYGMTDELAMKLIDNHEELPLLREAFEDGTLEITVNNSYAEAEQETSEELYYHDPTLLNFEEIITTEMTADEKLAVLKGTEKINFNVDISANGTQVPDNIRRSMEKKVGYKALDYFSFVVMKTIDAKSSLISTTQNELEVVLRIPAQYQRSGRTYCILREHNGIVDVLADLDTNPETITFRTNKFSEYAIAYEAVNVNRMILVFFIITLIALVFAVICYINLIRYRRKARAQRRAQEEEYLDD